MDRIFSIIARMRDRLAGMNVGDHIRTGFTALAVIVIGYAAADTAVTLSRLEIPKRPAANAAVKSSPVNATASGRADYNIITERNYFGSSSKPIASGDLKFKADYFGSSGSASALQLELMGTIADKDGRGYAIIEERDKKRQGLFKVGDSLAGATLKEVRRNAVVLNVSGKDEFLEIKTSPRDSLTGTGAPPSPSAPHLQRPQGRVPAVSPGSYGRPIAAPPATQADNPAIREVRDLLAEGQAKPHFNSGKMEGFYINKVKDGSYLQKAGLEDGDIVQSINNRKIESPNDVVWIQKAISNPADKVSLQVNRKGRQINLDVN